jgi:hypothetical protein
MGRNIIAAQGGGHEIIAMYIVFERRLLMIIRYIYSFRAWRVTGPRPRRYRIETHLFAPVGGGYQHPVTH